MVTGIPLVLLLLTDRAVRLLPRDAGCRGLVRRHVIRRRTGSAMCFYYEKRQRDKGCVPIGPLVPRLS